MALPVSPNAISLSQVQTEFGGSNPISISEYYGAASGVPTSGTISMSDFHGKSAAVAPISGTAYTYYYMEFNCSPNSPGTGLGDKVTKTYTYATSGNISLSTQTEGTTWTDGRSTTYGSLVGKWTKDGATVVTVTSPTGSGNFSAVVTAATAVANGNVFVYNVALVTDFRTTGTSDLARAWIRTGNDMSGYTLFT